MQFYEKVTFLPGIPEGLIKPLDIIESMPNVFPDPDYAHTYASYKANDDLQAWAQSYFDFPVLARYQVIKQQLPIHVDVGIVGIKYNYLISRGGDDVKTRWWDSVENPSKILFETTSPLRVWHSLNIEVPHDITEISYPRISVTIRKK
jgi:hypothetical protein